MRIRACAKLASTRKISGPTLENVIGVEKLVMADWQILTIGRNIVPLSERHVQIATKRITLLQFAKIQSGHQVQMDKPLL